MEKYTFKEVHKYIQYRVRISVLKQFALSFIYYFYFINPASITSRSSCG